MEKNGDINWALPHEFPFLRKGHFYKSLSFCVIINFVEYLIKFLDYSASSYRKKNVLATHYRTCSFRFVGSYLFKTGDTFHTFSNICYFITYV